MQRRPPSLSRQIAKLDFTPVQGCSVGSVLCLASVDTTGFQSHLSSRYGKRALQQGLHEHAARGRNVVAAVTSIVVVTKSQTRSTTGDETTHAKGELQFKNVLLVDF